jgi:hypothetical protein
MNNNHEAATQKLLEIITKVRYPKLILEEIVNVQPMCGNLLEPWFNKEQTPEEKAADDKLWNDMKIVREAIREKHPRGTEFIQDIIPCPICKDGIVSFIISDHYNGHIHAKCSKGCVDWME